MTLSHQETCRRLADAVSSFERQWMAVQAESVLVDLHDRHLLVTLCGAWSAAERAYAREDRSRKLLEQVYTESFDAVRKQLEQAIADILRLPVQSASLHLQPPSDVVIVFRLGQQ